MNAAIEGNFRLMSDSASAIHCALPALCSTEEVSPIMMGFEGAYVL